MGFFDLNIPYPEPSLATRASIESNRMKLVVKAMELGYTGIAYNRTITGVMSDHHHCSIPRLTLSSLLKLAPSLSMSAKLHRDLLGIPWATPFRQYTRLTVCVDSALKAQALNSGNPILKTYDLVAVRPLNQTMFDQACERLEVDIISIDFSEKLPFRLKQSMVKAAAERGVYFEVTYSGLITDVQIRRQLISNSKLLVDWTRGRNIILSSAAPSVNELRGPYDVANLLLILGLSKERARAAISKNCRILLANSIRKKQFYKEAIRVEVLSSDAASQSNEAWYKDLLKWDPVSSGEGDLLLDDLVKSFSASSKASKTAKAIDFASVIDSIPSDGFQVKDLLSASNVVPLFPSNNENSLPVIEKVNQSTTVLNSLTEQPSKVDICPKRDECSLSNVPTTHETISYDNCIEKNIPSGATEAFNLYEKIMTPTRGTELELKHVKDSDVKCTLLEAKTHDLESDRCIISGAVDIVVPDENEKQHISSADAELDDAHNTDGKVENFTSSMDINFPALVYDKHKNEKSLDVNLNEQIVKGHEALPKEIVKIAEHTSLEMMNTFISENVMEDEHLRNYKINAIELEEMPQNTPRDVRNMEDDSYAATNLSADVTMEDHECGVSTDSDQLAFVQSVSGRTRAKWRTPRGPLLFPFKRLLNRKPLQKKTQKIKCRTKIM